MPKSALETDIEKATSEVNVSEDWQMYMDICDRIKTSSTGPKEGLKCIMKRVNHQIPHVGLQALTLLSACVTNCGKSFHLEICSRDWTNGARVTITRSHEKISQKLRELIKKWVEEDFKDDPQLAIMDQFYKKLKQDGYTFEFSQTGKPSSSLSASLVSGPSTKSRSQQDDEICFKEDLDLAIAMSLQEAESNHGQRSSSNTGSSNQSSSLYPGFSSPVSQFQEERELFKVRALYDFVAAEDNEMTFQIGDIFSVLDNSDQNWWKGRNEYGVGLFPANFVTTELQIQEKSEKKVRFADEEQSSANTQQSYEQQQQKVQKKVKQKTVINEEHLDLTLSMLKNASPNEIDDEEETIVSMEDGCKEMGLLIEKKILEHDRRKDDLNDLNDKFLQALSMYQQLMKEPIVQPPKMPPQQAMYPLNQAPHSLQYTQQHPYQHPPPYSLQQQYTTVSQYGTPDQQYQQPPSQPTHARQPQQPIDPSYYNQQGPTSIAQQIQASVPQSLPQQQQPSVLYTHQIPVHSQQAPVQPQQPTTYNQQPSQSIQQQQQQLPTSDYQKYSAIPPQQTQQQQQQQQYGSDQYYNSLQQYPPQDYLSYDYNIPQNTPQQGFQQTPVYQ